jgi:ankyrin repeat protein
MDPSRPGRRNLIAVGVTVAIAGIMAAWWLSPRLQEQRRINELMFAARSGDIKRIGSILDKGADINARDRGGRTALMHAAHGYRPNIRVPASTDHPEVAEFLIKRGADANARTDTGFVALFWAARYGHDRTLKVLIDHGADVNAKDRDGVSALKWATVNEQAKVIELLKAAGARE